MGSKRYFAVNYVKPFSKNEKKKKKIRISRSKIIE
jgi:hypothetical protein